MTPLEKILLLSLRILKTAGSSLVTLGEKGLRIQKLNSARLAVLHEYEDQKKTAEPADNARLTLITYLNKLSERKIKANL